MFSIRAVTLLVVAALALGARADAAGPIQAAVDAAHAKYLTLDEGKNADYIPALAKVDPKLFGIALVTVDGKVNPDAAWYYPTPSAKAQEIANHVAFWKGVKIEAD